jgi:hypothetical protein
MNLFVLGANCEPLSGFKRLNVKPNPSPFDWLGFSTQDLPDLLVNKWQDDVFSEENLILYNSPTPGCFAAFDNKYKINSLHFFRKRGVENFHDLLPNQFSKFKENLLNRWSYINGVLQNPNEETVVVHNEFYPLWRKHTKEDHLQKAYEAILTFAPYSKIILATTQDRSFEKAVVLVKKKLTKDYFDHDRQGWLPTWDFLLKNKLKLGEVYKVYEKN